MNELLTKPCAILIHQESKPDTFVGTYNKPEHTDQDLSIQLVLIRDPHQASGLRLQVDVPHLDDHGNHQCERMHWSITAWNAASEPAELDGLFSIDDVGPEHYQELAELANALKSLSLSPSKRLLKLTIQRLLCTNDCRLFTGRTDYGEFGSHIAQLRQELRSAHPITLLLSGDKTDTMNKLDGVRKQMQLQMQSGLKKCWFNVTEAFAVSNINKSKMKRRNERPREFEWRAATTFTSPSEYALAAVAANEIEHELDGFTPDSVSNVPARFFKIPNNKTQLFAVFSISRSANPGDRKEAMKIQEKDLLWSTGDVESGVDLSFHCRVQQVLIKASREVVTAFMDCKFDPDTHKPILPSASVTLGHDVKTVAGLHRITTETAHSVKGTLKAKTSDTTYEFRRQGFDRCQHMIASSVESAQMTVKLLLGNELDTLSRVDMLGPLVGMNSTPEDSIGVIFRDLTSEQSVALQKIRDVWGGVAIIDGCAGSGKSHFTRCFHRCTPMP
ncbi:MAG: hypothetical protein Q9159_002306 [Coniocarpon cinnabarinum]